MVKSKEVEGLESKKGGLFYLKSMTQKTSKVQENSSGSIENGSLSFSTLPATLRENGQIGIDSSLPNME